MGAGRGGGFPQDPNSTACFPGVIRFPLGYPPALRTYPVPPPTTMIQQRAATPHDWAGTEAGDAVPRAGDSEDGGVLPRLLCPRHSRVGGGRDPHHEEVVLLAEEPPQPLVVPTDVQVPDVEALGWWAGKKRHQSLVTDTRARCPLAREEAPALPSLGHSREDGTLTRAAPLQPPSVREQGEPAPIPASGWWD